MLTSSMYEGNGSFASETISSNNRGSNPPEEEIMDSASLSTSFGLGIANGASDENVVAPPEYPPPAASGSSSMSVSFPPPPIRIVETSTADWRMMVVEENSNNNDTGANEQQRQHELPSMQDHEHDHLDDDDYELVQGGVLILDGISSTGGEEDNHGEDQDASLSVPDSDNIPSDPGTIHGPGGLIRGNRNWEHLISDDEGEEGDDEDDEGGATSRGRRRRVRFLTLGDLYPRICRFVRSTGDTIASAREGTTIDDASSSGMSTIATSLPHFLRSAGFPILVLAVTILVIPGYSYYHMAATARNHEARWIQLQQENARLQLQEERLRKEMEALQEEAVLAMAKATSAHREHEKWKLLNAANGGGDDKGFFLFDDDANCDKDSFTVIDNCWIKAKANVRLGNCGDDTKDFFKNIWNQLWSLPDYWGSDLYGDYGYDDPSGYYYTMEPYSPSPCHPSDSEEECRKKEKERDEYKFPYEEEDPIGTVFSAFHTFGKSLSDKMSQLMHNEVATTRKAATELEDAIHKGFSQASAVISDAMAATKNDMQALSQEVLTTLNSAVPKGKASSKETDDDGVKEKEELAPKTQTVSRKGLFDAASALSSLSKTWNEAVASMSSAPTSNRDQEK